MDPKIRYEIVAIEETVGDQCGKPNHATAASGHRNGVDYCLTCELEKELVEANMKIERLATVASWLRHIQASVQAGSWETAGDLYRGKQLFLSQDLLKQIDTALENSGQ